MKCFLKSKQHYHTPFAATTADSIDLTNKHAAAFTITWPHGQSCCKSRLLDNGFGQVTAIINLTVVLVAYTDSENTGQWCMCSRHQAEEVPRSFRSLIASSDGGDVRRWDGHQKCS